MVLSIMAMLTIDLRSLHISLLNKIVEIDVSKNLYKAMNNHLIGSNV